MNLKFVEIRRSTHMDNKLSPNQIFMKTIKYTIMRVLMPVIAVVISLVLLKVVTVFGLEKIEDDRIKLVFLAVWFVISILVYILIDTFFAYKFHAGQMAIITDAVSVNMIPDDMNDLAKDSLAYRFPSGNEFHTYKKLVKGSIQQLQMQLMDAQNYIAFLTGRMPMNPQGQPVQQGTPAQASGGRTKDVDAGSGNSFASGVMQAHTPMTSYGNRLAKRSAPDMNAGTANPMQ